MEASASVFCFSGLIALSIDSLFSTVIHRKPIHTEGTTWSSTLQYYYIHYNNIQTKFIYNYNHYISVLIDNHCISVLVDSPCICVLVDNSCIYVFVNSPYIYVFVDNHCISVLVIIILLMSWLIVLVIVIVDISMSALIYSYVCNSTWFLAS